MASCSFPEGLGGVGSLAGACHGCTRFLCVLSEQPRLLSWGRNPPSLSLSPSGRVPLCLPRRSGRDPAQLSMKRWRWYGDVWPHCFSL